jgi:hypothetical protein
LRSERTRPAEAGAPAAPRPAEAQLDVEVVGLVVGLLAGLVGRDHPRDPTTTITARALREDADGVLARGRDRATLVAVPADAAVDLRRRAPASTVESAAAAETLAQDSAEGPETLPEKMTV